MQEVEDHVRFAELLRIYGNLLSRRQREYMRLYYIEDLSYGEIAEQSNISRQAVHDAIAHARKALLRFERELSLLGGKHGDGLDMESIMRVVERLERLVSDDIIYDTTRLRKAVRELKTLLRVESTDV